MSETYLFYCPPKSQLRGHTIRNKDHLKAAVKLHAVVNKYSKTGVSQGNTIELKLEVDLYELNELDRKKIIEIISEEFGERNPAYPTKPGDFLASHQWIVPYSRLENIIEFYRANYHKNLRMVYSYAWEWLDKSRSLCRMTIQLFENKFLVSTHFHFPYEIKDPRLLSFLSEFNDALPFELSEKNFRYTISNKSGSFNYHKIDPEFSKALSLILKKKK